MVVRRLRVAVVGAGIGGLATAIALRRQGADVVVYEQASQIRAVGAGIAVGANGSRLLRRLGIDARVARVAVRPARVEFRHWRSGRILASHLLAEAYEERFGAPLWTIQRGDLQRALLDEYGDGPLMLSRRCTEVTEEADGVRLRFADGCEAEADVVVGADGVHSAVRARVFGPDEAIFSKTSAYRALVPMDALAHLAELSDPVLWLWFGPGRHFVAYPVAGGRLLNFLAVVPDEQWTIESWTTRGDPGEARAAFAGWHPFVTEILAATGPIGRWALYDRDPLRRWSTSRVTLLGDAAHSMLPHHGQGANQALEDAVVLARLLGGASPLQTGGALRRYESLRRVRTRQLQAGSRRNANCFQLPDGPEADSRNARLANLPDDLTWIHGFDADTEREPALSRR
jgi:2-polyprenyl-6-methoxyphenol hydroxylase-like FAD-dependent oxidoreductase